MGCGASQNSLKAEGALALLSDTTLEVDFSAEEMMERGWGNEDGHLPHNFFRNVWRTKSLRKLSLSGQNLKHVDRVLALRQLEELDVSDNEIVEMPFNLSKLSNLRKLIAFKNNCITLPKSICKLSKLEELSFYNNKLERVPDDINNLVNLVHINFGSNYLTELPPLDKCVKLQTIKCQMCKIKRIQGTWETLLELEEIIFNTNELMALPRMPPNIQSIDVVANQLESVVDALVLCENLKELKANQNKIVRVPQSCLTKSLNILSLASNIRITEIPAEIKQSPHLRCLVIGGCMIKKLPRELLELNELRRVNFTRNPLDLEDPTTKEVFEKLKVQCLEEDESGKPHGYFRWNSYR